ncbi:MAG: CapA family protein [Chloroflexi bacterium]|nr:CapA family protein [Chloroflexota bacterium]
MKTEITVAVTGESIINRRLSVHTEDRFLSLLKILRGADVAFTHLETIIHDYDGPEVYPAALAGNTWQRSPRFVADELKWAGFQLVSLAHNHTMDYSYGGLFATWKALDKAGLVHAGTGMNLGEAREPKYVDTARGRVALIAICSSITPSARAGEARRDVKGRPGVNPLRYHYVADAETIEIERQRAVKIGWIITKVGKIWLFNPPGCQLAFQKWVEGDKPGISMVAEEDDVEGNLRSVRDAARQADYVLVYLHNHEWDPEKGPGMPATFVPPFARACIDAGAHIFVGEGNRPPKGIEIHKGKPIFYGPGGFISMSTTVTRLPADFYLRPEFGPEARRWEATTADAFDAREALPKKLNPRGDSSPTQVKGSVVALCSLGQDGRLTELKLYPISLTDKPRPGSGVPMLAQAETAERITAHLGELSAPFGTRIEHKGGNGLVALG